MTVREGRPRAASVVSLILTLAVVGPAVGQTAPPNARGVEPQAKGPQFNLLKKVAFDQNLNAQLPLATPLRDESGRAVTLGDYFEGKKPVVLLFVYYECPMLCNLELNGLVRNVRTLSLSAGREYDIVAVSFDAKDTPRIASAKKRKYLDQYNRPGSENGWHFLTGDAAPVKALADVAGFHYAFDERSGQYAHPAGLIVATPRGRISRYVYGIDFPASDLRWSLVEASEGKVGSPVDKLLLMCFHYDPSTGRYNFAVMSVVRLLGVATAVALAVFMIRNLRRERRRAAAASNADPLSGAGAVGA